MLQLFFNILVVSQNNNIISDPRDGKTYKTIKIGTQTWMAQNLAYKVNSGCWAYDNNVKNIHDYGYLYDWQAAITVCPSGWHLPSANDWTQLLSFLGSNVAEGKMKEKGTSHWLPPNNNATNSSGFSALPAGCYDGFDNFSRLTRGTTFWTSTQSRISEVKVIDLDYRSDRVYEAYSKKTYGYSVRCLKK